MDRQCVELIVGSLGDAAGDALVARLEKDRMASEPMVHCLTVPQLVHKYGVDEAKAVVMVEAVDKHVQGREKKAEGWKT